MTVLRGRGRLPVCLMVASLLLMGLPAQGEAPPGRRLAVTVDDLPLSRMRGGVEGMAAVTGRLLEGFEAGGVPVVGFVNESKLEVDGELVPGRVALLERWLDAGFELGNHTFGHVDLHRVSVEEFTADVLRGERVVRRLLAARGRELRWFRHPYLHTGRSLETKRAVEAFLAEHGYRVAPVTVDNSEWIFALAYDRALDRGDRDTAERLGAAYVDYMLAKTAYYEAQTEALFDRPIPHVLLIHANRLNADHFPALAKALRDAGVRFIPLDGAVRDPAYDSEDTYTGPAGISWLHRWALTREVETGFFAGEPKTPRWVLDAAGVESE